MAQGLVVLEERDTRKDLMTDEHGMAPPTFVLRHEPAADGVTVSSRQQRLDRAHPDEAMIDRPQKHVRLCRETGQSFLNGSGPPPQRSVGMDDLASQLPDEVLEWGRMGWLRHDDGFETESLYDAMHAEDRRFSSHIQQGLGLSAEALRLASAQEQSARRGPRVAHSPLSESRLAATFIYRSPVGGASASLLVLEIFRRP